MKKIYIIIIVLLVLAAAGIIGFRYFIVNNIVPLADIKMNQGELVNVSEDGIVIKYTTPELVDGQDIEKEKEVQYFIDSDSILYAQTKDLKTEEEFRKDEQEYSNWDKLSNEEKTKAGFKLPADWRKNIKISFADLKAGNKLKIFYFNKEYKDFVIMAIKLDPGEEQGAPIDNGRELKFFASVVELENSQLKVVINDNLNAKISSGAEYDIDLSKINNFEISELKIADKFRSEEIIYQQTRKKIQEEGGDVSNLKAPDWYDNKMISVEDLHLQKGDSIRIFAFVSAEGVITPSKIQKIKK